MSVWEQIHAREGSIRSFVNAAFAFAFGIYWAMPGLSDPVLDLVMAPPSTTMHAELVADGTVLVALIVFVLAILAAKKVDGGDSA